MRGNLSNDFLPLPPQQDMEGSLLTRKERSKFATTVKISCSCFLNFDEEKNRPGPAITSRTASCRKTAPPGAGRIAGNSAFCRAARLRGN